MRILYSVLLYLALPYLFLRLLWRSRGMKDYRLRLSERMGFYPFRLSSCLWVHAVSVGETIAALPLIKKLKAQYPSFSIVVTTMTPTGAARVKAALGESVAHAYLPYDFPGAVSRFLKAAQPRMAIIMETELWPNMFAACHKKSIPVCVLNARLSEKSAAGYARIAPLTREMLQNITSIAAQSEADANRFIELGAAKEKVIVTGSIKFDLELPHDLAVNSFKLREQLGEDRFIWIAGSTREGEDEIVLVAHQQLLAHCPNALLILVPRHPERFDAVAKLAEDAGLIIARRSQLQSASRANVYLCDSMGELLLMYAASDVAFVGGSLVPHGGHNMLEAAVLGKPVLTGPHVFNFIEISEKLIAAQALIKIFDATTLTDQLMNLHQHATERAQMGARAMQVVEANRGALIRQLEMVKRLLSVSLLYAASPA